MPDRYAKASEVIERVRHDKLDIPSDRRNLVRLWSVLKDSNARLVHTKLKESRIEEATNRFRNDQGDLKTSYFSEWAKLNPSDERQQVLLLIAAIRILDSKLAANPPSAIGGSQSRDWLFLTEADDIPSSYVIRSSTTQTERYSRHRKRARSVLCRALVHHRILPKTLPCGRNLNLCFLNDRDGMRDYEIASDRTVLGGVLFDDLSIDTRKQLDENGEDTFVVEAANIQRRHEQVDAAMKSAYRDRCDVVAFPELTIDPESRLQISMTLAESSYRFLSNNIPMLTIAGSWHEKGSDLKYKNVCPVYNRYGNVIATHEKFSRYYNENLGEEGIEPGNSVLCIVTRRGTFAVAICLDFCDRNVRPVYPEIDSDYMIVISMGGNTTMRSHIETANECYTRWRGRSFVLQQSDDAGRKPILGYVLRASKAADATWRTTVSQRPWNIWDTSQPPALDTDLL